MNTSGFTYSRVHGYECVIGFALFLFFFLSCLLLHLFLWYLLIAYLFVSWSLQHRVEHSFASLCVVNNLFFSSSFSSNFRL